MFKKFFNCLFKKTLNNGLEECNFPIEIENIIFEYKKDFDKIHNIFSLLKKNIIDKKINIVERKFLVIIEKLNLIDEINYIVEILLEDMNYINFLEKSTCWSEVGSGNDTLILDCTFNTNDRVTRNYDLTFFNDKKKRIDYLKIEEIPYTFIEKYKEKIDWRWIGSGLSYYTSFQKLPYDFKEKFGNKINECFYNI